LGRGKKKKERGGKNSRRVKKDPERKKIGVFLKKKSQTHEGGNNRPHEKKELGKNARRKKKLGAVITVEIPNPKPITTKPKKKPNQKSVRASLRALGKRNHDRGSRKRRSTDKDQQLGFPFSRVPLPKNIHHRRKGNTSFEGQNGRNGLY